MNFKLFLVLLFYLLFFMSLSCAMVDDRSFELPPGNWTYTEVDTNSVFSGANSTDYAVDGVWSYNFSQTSTSDAGDYMQILQTGVDLSAINNLSFSLREITHGSGNRYIRIQFYINDTKEYDEEGVLTTDTDTGWYGVDIDTSGYSGTNYNVTLRIYHEIPCIYAREFYVDFFTQPPNTPTLISPTNLSIERSSPVTLNVISSDLDDDPLTYYFYGGTDPNSMSFLGTNNSAGGHTFNWSIYTYDEYYWTAKAGDAGKNSSNMTTAQFTAIVPPNVTINYLNNSDVELWSGGATSNPDNWTYSVGSFSIYQEPIIVYSGSYSARLTGAAPYGLMGQTVNATLLEYLNGKVITGGAWVYSSSADTAKVYALSSTAWYPSSYHTGDNTWQWLTVSDTITPDDTTTGFGFYADTSYTAYFDGAVLVEGYDTDITPQPENGSTIYQSYPPLTYDVDFDWQDTGAPSYRLVVASDQYFNQIAVDEFVSTDESTQELLVGDVYYWRIYSYDGSYYSNSSPIWHFTLTGNTSLSGSWIEGVVYQDSDGTYTPLSGAEVTAWNDTWSDTVITGSNGYYNFNVTAGQVYSIQAKRDLFLDSSIALVNATSTVHTQNFYLLPDRTSEEWRHYTKFIVTTIWGTRYPNVSVSVYENGDVTALYTGETGADGSITFVMNRQTQYRITFVNSTLGINEQRYIYPKDDVYYIIVSSSLGSWDSYDTPIADAIDFDISTSIINSSSAYVNVSYLDTSNGTTDLVVYLNETNSSDIFNQSVVATWSPGGVNNSSHSFVVSPHAGRSFFVHLTVQHSVYDEIDSTYAVSFDDDISSLFPGLPPSIFLYTAMFLLMFVGGIWTTTHVEQGLIVLPTMNFIFLGLGCYNSLPSSVQTSIWGGTVLVFVLGVVANLNKASKSEGYK